MLAGAPPEKPYRKFERISTEELKAELEHRQRIEAENEVPKQLPDMDFAPLIKVCQAYIDGLHNDGYVDEDLIHYIFEAAMESVFGKDVWKWINTSRK